MLNITPPQILRMRKSTAQTVSYSSNSSNRISSFDGSTIRHPNFRPDSRTKSSKPAKSVLSRSGSARSKVHLVKGTSIPNLEPTSASCNVSSSTLPIDATAPTTTPSKTIDMASFFLRFIQSLKNRSASSDELMLCPTLEKY